VQNGIKTSTVLSANPQPDQLLLGDTFVPTEQDGNGVRHRSGALASLSRQAAMVSASFTPAMGIWQSF